MNGRVKCIKCSCRDCCHFTLIRKAVERRNDVDVPGVNHNIADILSDESYTHEWTNKYTSFKVKPFKLSDNQSIHLQKRPDERLPKNANGILQLIPTGKTTCTCSSNIQEDEMKVRRKNCTLTTSNQVETLLLWTVRWGSYEHSLKMMRGCFGSLHPSSGEAVCQVLCS